MGSTAEPWYEQLEGIFHDKVVPRDLFQRGGPSTRDVSTQAEIVGRRSVMQSTRFEVMRMGQNFWMPISIIILSAMVIL